MKILAMGEVLWDMLPGGPRIGGAPLNFACHAALLGADVSLLSAVGDDKRGEDAIENLRRFGVDLGLLQTVPNAMTGTVGVDLCVHGHASYVIHDCASWDHIAPVPDAQLDWANTDAVYFGTLGQRSALSREAIRDVLKAAGGARCMRVLDVNLRAPFYDASLIRESVGMADILKLSKEELSEVASALGADFRAVHKTVLQEMLRLTGLQVIVMTCGADGAVLVTQHDVVEQPGIPTMVRDTIGAGDSFTAALIVGLLRGDSYPEVLRQACATASDVCAMDGAVPPPPSTVRSVFMDGISPVSRWRNRVGQFLSPAPSRLIDRAV